MTNDEGIHIIANFMFGLPDDDYLTMQETLCLALEINAEWGNFYTTPIKNPGRNRFTDKEGPGSDSSGAGPETGERRHQRLRKAQYGQAGGCVGGTDRSFTSYFPKKDCPSVVNMGIVCRIIVDILC